MTSTQLAWSNYLSSSILLVMQAIVNGVLVEYHISGKGEAILMLHGWGDSKSTYRQLVRSLENDYTIINIDLPGFGNSQTPNAPWNLDDYVEFLVNFLQKINVANIYCIMCQSNGGAIAIQAIGTKKIISKRLVLLAASGIRDRSKSKKSILKITSKFGKLLTLWLPQRYRTALQKKLYGSIGSDLLVVPELKETFKLIVKQDVRHSAKQITIPTLLIYGKNDKDTPVKSVGSLLYESIKDSEMKVIDNAAHFVHHDQPTLVNSYINEFLT